MSDDPQENLLDLTAAERFFRHVADDARADAAAGRWVSDTAECYRLVVDELDRLRARVHELAGEGPEPEHGAFEQHARVRDDRADA